MINIYILIGLFAAGLVTGWRAEVWHEAYKLEKIEDKTIKKLGEGESNIIDFNQKFSKETINAKDDCLNKPIPTNIIGLLH